MRGKGHTRDSLKSLGGGVLSPYHAFPLCDSRKRQNSWLSTRLWIPSARVLRPVGGDLLLMWPHLDHIHLCLHGLVSGSTDKAHAARQVLSTHHPTHPILSPSVFPGCNSQCNLVSHSQLLNSHSGIFSSHSMRRNIGTVTDEKRNPGI